MYYLLLTCKEVAVEDARTSEEAGSHMSQSHQWNQLQTEKEKKNDIIPVAPKSVFIYLLNQVLYFKNRLYFYTRVITMRSVYLYYSVKNLQRWTDTPSLSLLVTDTLFETLSFDSEE